MYSNFDTKQKAVLKSYCNWFKADTLLRVLDAIRQINLFVVADRSDARNMINGILVQAPVSKGNRFQRGHWVCTSTHSVMYNWSKIMSALEVKTPSQAIQNSYTAAINELKRDIVTMSVVESRETFEAMYGVIWDSQ